MKTYFYILFSLLLMLLSSLNSTALAPMSDSIVKTHFELAAKVNGGSSIFVFRKRNFDHFSSEVAQHTGTFYGGGLQLSLVGRSSFGLVVEAGYGVSSCIFDYAISNGSPGGSSSAAGNYTLKIRKTEFSVLCKHFLDEDKCFYIDYGIYDAIEDSKRASGVQGASSAGINSPSSSSNFELNDYPFPAREQIGTVAGFGYNFRFKNKTFLFIDYRFNFHGIQAIYTKGGTYNDRKFRQLDFCFSLGYTFYSGKGRKSK